MDAVSLRDSFCFVLAFILMSNRYIHYINPTIISHLGGFYHNFYFKPLASDGV